MAIKVEVHEYCANCMDFVADVERPVKMYDGFDNVVYQTDTIIKCDHRGQCEEIRRYLESEIARKAGT